MTAPISLATHVGTVNLANPIMPASGTFDYHSSPRPPFDVHRLGALVLKSITWNPQKGNPPPRLAETPSGLINSIGIPSPGMERFLGEVLPHYTVLNIPLVASVAGYTPDEYARIAAELNSIAAVTAVELNLSCPNIAYHRMPAQDPALLKECVAAARSETTKPLWAKLSPDVPSVGMMAAAAEASGADACTVINTAQAMMVNIETGRPMIGAGMGGLSGPALLPIALAAVWDVTLHTRIPVIGVGGIRSADDVIAFLMAGASAVQIGTASFYNPSVMVQILQDLNTFMALKHFHSLAEIIGMAHGAEIQEVR